MHLMADAPFKRLKHRWEAIHEDLDDPEQFDQAITPALKVMNEIDGLVTIFSCQGHVELHGPLKADGYIMFGVQDPTVLYRFFTILAEKSGFGKNKIGLTMSQRGDITDRCINKDPKNWYPVWILSWVVTYRYHTQLYAAINQAAFEAVQEFKGVSVNEESE